MPPKKLTPKTPQQNTTARKPTAPQNTPTKPANAPSPHAGAAKTSQPPRIPEQDVKQSSSMSAGYALEAGKKAYELRQAAVAAGDPDAREQILAKAINKEIEAESFGKAAKYARTGAFQGLAAGAGIGVAPGATIGKLTGALVGGLLSTVGGLLGGGIGTAYGAIAGPMWDLGGMASHGVRQTVGNFIGDWPDFGQSTQHQKDSLEKMVLGAQKTKPPNQGELEEMRADDGGASQESYQNFAQDMSSYLPGLDSLPTLASVSKNIPSMQGMSQSMPSIPGMGGLAGGLGQPSVTPKTQPAPTSATGVQKPPKLQKRQSLTVASQQAPKHSQSTPSANTSRPRQPAPSPKAPTNATKPPKLEKRNPASTPSTAKASTASKLEPRQKLTEASAW